MYACPFWSFLNGSSALGSSSKSPAALLICIPCKVQQACSKSNSDTETQFVFLTLNQMKGSLFARRFLRTSIVSISPPA